MKTVRQGDAFGDRLCGEAAEAFAHIQNILDEVVGKCHVAQRIEHVERRDDAMGIVDRDGRIRCQLRQQREGRLRGERVRQRLVDRVAADIVAERFNAQRHRLRPYRETG